MCFPRFGISISALSISDFSFHSHFIHWLTTHSARRPFIQSHWVSFWVDTPSPPLRIVCPRCGPPYDNLPECTWNNTSNRSSTFLAFVHVIHDKKIQRLLSLRLLYVRIMYIMAERFLSYLSDWIVFYSLFFTSNNNNILAVDVRLFEWLCDTFKQTCTYSYNVWWRERASGRTEGNRWSWATENRGMQIMIACGAVAINAHMPVIMFGCLTWFYI